MSRRGWLTLPNSLSSQTAEARSALVYLVQSHALGFRNSTPQFKSKLGHMLLLWLCTKHCSVSSIRRERMGPPWQGPAAQCLVHALTAVPAAAIVLTPGAHLSTWVKPRMLRGLLSKENSRDKRKTFRSISKPAKPGCDKFKFALFTKDIGKNCKFKSITWKKKTILKTQLCHILN